MRIFPLILLIIAAPLSAQKKQLKQARALEANQQYELAIERYKDLLHKNASNVDAKAGFRRMAQKVADNQLSNYFIARNSGDIQKAVGLFEEVIHTQEEAEYFNVSIQIPSYYFEDYEEDKKRLKEALRTDKIREEHDAKEHTYENAIQLFNQGDWISASEIFRSLNGFKDTDVYLKKIKSSAKRLAIVASKRNQFSNEETLRNTLLSELLKLNNPLVSVINRNNLDELIEEQKLGLSGLLDEGSVADLGKILGVEWMVITRILNYNLIEGDKRSQVKTAYVARVNNNLKDYYPVSYYESSQQGRLEVSFQYQLIDVATAEILMADIIYEVIEDDLYYATYQGDPNTLFPSNGTHIYTKGKERKTFLSLFNAPSQLMSKKDLDIEVQKLLAKKVAISLDNFLRQ